MNTENVSRQFFQRCYNLWLFLINYIITYSYCKNYNLPNHCQEVLYFIVPAVPLFQRFLRTPSFLDANKSIFGCSGNFCRVLRHSFRRFPPTFPTSRFYGGFEWVSSNWWEQIRRKAVVVNEWAWTLYRKDARGGVRFGQCGIIIRVLVSSTHLTPRGVVVTWPCFPVVHIWLACETQSGGWTQNRSLLINKQTNYVTETHLLRLVKSKDNCSIT